MPRDRDDRYDDEDDDDRPRRRSRRDDFDEEDDDRPRSRRRRYEDDEDDRPRRRYDDRPAASASNGMATAALVLGLLSFCFGLLTGIPGVIFGILGMKKPTGRGMAMTGLILSLVGSAVSIAAGVYAYYAIQDVAAKRINSNNMRMLGLGAHNHNDAYGKLPLPFVPRTGEPAGMVPTDLDDRLSWRVAMLPFINQDGLWHRFKRDEPWNSPANQPLAAVVVKPYADADDLADPATRYRCFYGNGAAFDTRFAARIPGSFPDGTSNTILYVEGAEKVTWSRFGEYKFDPAGPLPPLGHPKRDVFAAAMGDGSIRWVRKSVNPHTLKAAITANGGEVMGADW